MPAVERLTGQLGDYLGPDQVNLVRRAYFYAEQAHAATTTSPTRWR